MIKKTVPAIALGLITLALAGCVQPAGSISAPYAGAPVQSAVPNSPYRATIQTPPPAPRMNAPVQSAVPGSTSLDERVLVNPGPVDSRTGMYQAALVSVMGGADSGRYTVMFRPERSTPAQVDAAPATICAQSGSSVVSSRTNSPSSGSAMPGIQIMIVECSAA